MAKTTYTEEEVQKLKDLIEAFKKQYHVALGEAGKKAKLQADSKNAQNAILNEENNALTEQLVSLKKHFQSQFQIEKGTHTLEIERLERELKSIKARYEETDQLRDSFERQSLELLRKLQILEEQAALIDEKKRKEGKDYQDETQSQIQRDKQLIDKLAAQVLERDKKISELLYLEISLKKAAEQKLSLEAYCDEQKNLQESQSLKIRHLEKELEGKDEQIQEVLKEFQLQKDLNDEQMLQLQKIISTFQAQVEDISSERNQLAHQIIEAKKSIERLRDEQTGFEQTKQEEIEALRHLRKEDAERLEKARLEKEEGDKEIQQLQRQFSGLRSHVLNLENDLEISKISLLETLQKLELTLQQKENLTQALEEINQNNRLFEKEINHLKSSLVRGLRELKELEVQYEQTVQEKIGAGQKFQQAQHQIDSLRGEIANYQDMAKQALQEQKNSLIQVEELNEQLHLSQEAAEEKNLALRAKQNEIHDLEHVLTSFEQEQKERKEEISRLRDALKEKEAELSQAQQHLGKKVKEAAILDTKNNEQRTYSESLQQTVTQQKIKIAELQTSLELHSQQQKKIEEQLQEGAKSHEFQLSKWEEKYFLLYEKWQKAETRVKEMENLEEKQKHLQGLLANLGNFFTPHHLPNTPSPKETFSPVKEAPLREIAQKEMTPQKEMTQREAIFNESIQEEGTKSPNLFNLTKPTIKPRQSFLE